MMQRAVAISSSLAHDKRPRHTPAIVRCVRGFVTGRPVWEKVLRQAPRHAGALTARNSISAWRFQSIFLITFGLWIRKNV